MSFWRTLESGYRSRFHHQSTLNFVIEHFSETIEDCSLFVKFRCTCSQCTGFWTLRKCKHIMRLSNYFTLFSTLHQFCNSIWRTNDISKIFTWLFNIWSRLTAIHMSYPSKSDRSRIECWWYAVQIRHGTRFPVWSHCHRGTTSSDDEIGRSHWVPRLVISRVGVTAIPIQYPLTQPMQHEQGSTMTMRSNRPPSRTWRACCMHQEFYFFDWHQRALRQM